MQETEGVVSKIAIETPDETAFPQKMDGWAVR